MIDEIQFNLVKAQLTMRHYANTKHQDLSFEEGDWFFKLQAYRQQS